MTTPLSTSGHSVPSRAERLHAMLPLLVDALPDLLEEVGALLRAEWPEYADFLDVHRDEVAGAGAVALASIVEMTEHTSSPPRRGPDDEPDVVGTLFAEIGRAQWRRGNPLTMLLSAYQTGARAAWQQISRIAIDRRVPATEVAILADALFGFVDQLSSASADGYLAEQNEAAASRERARAALADLLLSGHGSLRTIEDAARRAGWPLPQSAAVVLLDPDQPLSVDIVSRAAAAGWLPMNQALVLGFLVGDPHLPQRRRRLEEMLAGTSAVIGPGVPLTQLSGTLPLARVAQRLRRSGVITDDPVRLEDHLDAILVHQDESLLRALEQQLLCPLDALPALTRARLEETLASWLRHMGDRAAMAEELHIHRQTVRYRMGQLHELLGDRLTDPGKRLALVLALGWRAPERDDAAAAVSVTDESGADTIDLTALDGVGRD